MLKIHPTLLSICLLATAPLPGLVMPPPEREPIGTFTFIHMSDTHVGPHLTMPANMSEQRGFVCVQTLRDSGPIYLEPFRETVEAPSFVVITGDVTEYGFAGATTEATGAYFDNLGVPHFWVAGNHDNTWVTDSNLFRERHGGLNYSFQYEGVHFIGLNSATIQDPVPSFGPETISYLERTLQRIGREAPVVVMFHHPLSDSTFASDYDKERLLDVMRPHNVLFYLVGHHHVVRVEEDWGLKGIHGGSTFSKTASDNPVDGYNVVSFKDGEVRVVYRYCGQDAATVELLAMKIPARSSYPAITISKPKRSEELRRDFLEIEAAIDFPTANIASAVARIDRETVVPLTLRNGRAIGRAELGELANGSHNLRIDFRSTDGRLFHRSTDFHLDRKDRAGEGIAQWRYAMEGSSKTTPLITRDLAIAGDNAGFLHAVRRKNGKPAWTFSAGGEILGRPAWYNETIIFGAGNGSIHALTNRGRILWSRQESAAVYTPAAVDEYGFVYFGTNDAQLICLDASTGEEVWRNSDADFSIEAAPIITGDLVVFGAWDGYVYALDRGTGSQRWRALSPKCQESGRLVRYNGAADDSPVRLGDVIYFADRGYVLGGYSLNGEYVGPLHSAASAVALNGAGNALLVRTTNRAFASITPEGTANWEADFAGGRIPSPPVEVNGLVYTIENSGRLRVLDAATGENRWGYQVTPQLYVMSSPAVADGIVYTTGMDGMLTAIAPPRP